MTNFYDAMTYDEGEAELVLKAMVQSWPKLIISTVTWGGFLETRKEMMGVGRARVQFDRPAERLLGLFPLPIEVQSDAGERQMRFG